MNSTTTTTDQQPRWKSGTELRDDATGIYQWPHQSFVLEDPTIIPVFYPSVTTVLDEYMGGGMRFAEAWFQAEYASELALAAKEKRTVEVWLETDNVDGGEVVTVNPIQILLNTLPEAEFGSNFGKHWMKKAGPREMRRRANRGSILHDGLEEFAYGLQVESDEVGDYCTQLIQSRDFRIDREFVEPYMRQMLLWCQRHIEEVEMAEAIVMSDTYSHAGTLDTRMKLRGYPELEGRMGIVDAKGSKQDQPSHELQGAAYFYSEYAGIRNTMERIPLEQPEWFCNLYVQPDKVTLRHWPRIVRTDDPESNPAYQAFLYGRLLWQGMYQDLHPKTMKPNVVKRGDFGLPPKLLGEITQGKLPV